MGGPVAKQFMLLGGEPLLVHALRSLGRWKNLSGVVVVTPESDLEAVRSGILPRVSGVPVLRVVPGGAERQDSVRNGLQALTEAAPGDVVLIHDGVRPFPPSEKLDELAAAADPDGAILATGCRDTVKKVEYGRIAATVDRSELALAQTPQAFPYGRILEAHLRAHSEGLKATDDASVMEAFGARPRVVEGDSGNIKVTTPDDMLVAESLMGKGQDTRLRIGQGYDAHRLVEGRPLIIGGVNIPHPLGLLGHSDADVLAHAVADACLGAARLGDIGRHFPDTDKEWKGADSMKLLALVAEKISGRGGRIVSVDATLMAQRPRIAPHIPEMESNIAKALGIPPDAVNVKATTTEGMGFVGRMEGMAAQAVALVLVS